MGREPLGSRRSQQGGGDLADLALKLAYLRSLQDKRKLDKEVAIEGLRTKSRQDREARQKESDVEFEQGIEATTGSKYTPEMGPFFAEAREQYRIPKSGSPPLTTGGSIGKPVGGDPSQGFVVHQEFVSPETRQRAMLFGGQRMRRETVGSIGRMSEDAYGPTGAQSIREVQDEATLGKRILTTDQAQKEIAERIKLKTAGAGAGQALSKERTDVAREPATVAEAFSGARIKGAEATSKESDARIAVKTEEARGARIVAESKGVELTTQKKEAEAPYYAIIAQNESRIKQSEATIKEGEASRQGIITQKAGADVEHVRLQNTKLKQDASDASKVRSLTDSYLKEADPEKAKQLVRNIAVITGHPQAVITDDRAQQMNFIKTLEDREKFNITLQDAISKSDLNRAQSTSEAYNQASLTAAIMSQSPSVRITAIRDEGGYAGGVSLRQSTVDVPTPIGRMFTLGILDQAARQKPGQPPVVYTDTDGQQKILDPAQALHVLTLIRRDYQKTPSAYADEINKSDAQPETKTRALQLINKPIPGMTSVTPQISESGVPDANIEKRAQIRGRIKESGRKINERKVAQQQGERIKEVETSASQELKAARITPTQELIDEYVNLRLNSNLSNADAIIAIRQRLDPSLR